MAFESLNQALANTFSQIAFQQTPAGQADILGKRLQNAVVENQLTKLFPLQVQQLQKTVDFMISEPEKQRLAIEQDAAKQKLNASLQELENRRLHGYDMSKQGLLGGQKLNQIDREWFYRLQEKKIPSVHQYISGDKELTPQEFVQKAALTGKFEQQSLDEFENKFLKTGEADYSLIKPVEEVPKFGALTTAETDELKNKIMDSAAFKNIVESNKDKPEFSKYKWPLGQSPKGAIFDAIVNGEMALPQDNALKSMFDSYRYSSTGVRANVVEKVEIPEFKSKEEYEIWMTQNADAIRSNPELVDLLKQTEKKNGWYK